MKNLILVTLVMPFFLLGCDEGDSGSGGQGSKPGTKPDTQALAAEVLKLNGQSPEKVILKLATQIEKHNLESRLDQVIEALDENFLIECEALCSIQQKTDKKVDND